MVRYKSNKIALTGISRTIRLPTFGGASSTRVTPRSITLQRQRKTASGDPRFKAFIIRRSRHLSSRQTARTFLQRRMRNSFRSCVGRDNVSVWSPHFSMPPRIAQGYLARCRAIENLWPPRPDDHVARRSNWPSRSGQAAPDTAAREETREDVAPVVAAGREDLGKGKRDITNIDRS